MIVGISGKVGSGKTTLADYLVQKTNNGLRKMSFASLLKEVVVKLIGCEVEDFASQEFKLKWLPDWNMSVGQFLQWFGTDICRATNPGVWVNRLMEKAEGLDVVIDDVRFKNEAMEIIKHGGVVIRLDGDPAKSNRDPNHRSETDLDDFAGFRLRINTDKSLRAATGRKTLAFIEERFGCKFNLVGDKQHEFKILRESFEVFFGEGFSRCIQVPEDLNKSAVDIIRETLEFINTNDPLVQYGLRNGLNSDIRPEIVDGKINSLIIDSIDGSKC